jgi:(E)-4-hydroxy-3-methylbut-2-enyl-diphosphate synthase
MSSKEIKLGDLSIGGGSSIKIQSMTNTKDYVSTLNQVKDLVNVGCEIIRISVPDEKSLSDFLKIKNQINTALIADIHFDPNMAIKCLENGVLGVRINPGNIGSKDLVRKIVLLALEKNAVIRIGVNSGSLEKEILKKYSHPSAVALAESCLNWVSFFESLDYFNFKISIKSSDISTMIVANEIVSKRTDAPLHIGLTEAGPLISGLVKSSISTVKLLEKGIGDTIRVSLSDDPVSEVIAAKSILKSLGKRKGVEIISCPTCARTSIDVIGISKKIEKDFNYLDENIKIAIMGCVVNGPGEAKESDIGVAGVNSKEAAIFEKDKILEKIPLDKTYEKLTYYVNKMLKGDK